MNRPTTAPVRRPALILNETEVYQIMDSKVKGLMGDSFENLRTLIDVNSIIGDPISTPDGTTIIPVSKVTFGYGMGGSDLPTNKREAFGGGTAGGVTIQGRQCAAGAAGRGKQHRRARHEHGARCGG